MLYSYHRERIHGQGRYQGNSIVIVLMGCGFTQAQQTAFRNHAISATNYMMNFHPFSLFRDQFIVYAVHTPSSQSWVSNEGNTTNRFRTYRPASNRIGIPAWGRDQARAVANWASDTMGNPDMIQVIVNTTGFGGVA